MKIPPIYPTALSVMKVLPITLMSEIGTNNYKAFGMKARVNGIVKLNKKGIVKTVSLAYNFHQPNKGFCFSIYDEDDNMKLVARIIKENEILDNFDYKVRNGGDVLQNVFKTANLK